MSVVTLQVVYEDARFAEKISVSPARPGDCGIDLFNATSLPLVVPPRVSIEVPAGIRVKIPDGYCGFIRPRSSTFHRRRLFVIEGIIDSGYTGPLFTHVWNPALNGYDQPIVIEPWERLGQLIVLPVPVIDVRVVSALPATARGASGFGSTGR